MEEWRDVVGYENKYLASKNGSVRSIQGKKQRVLKPFNRNGYQCVRLGDGNGNIKTLYIHRLVAAAFIGAIDEGMHINHKDGNKQNNNIDNLEIVTPRDNILHSHYVLGNRLKPVKMIDKNTGEIIKEFISIRDARKETKINEGDISSVCNKKRKTAGGYVWKYS